MALETRPHSPRSHICESGLLLSEGMAVERLLQSVSKMAQGLALQADHPQQLDLASAVLAVEEGLPLDEVLRT